MDEDTKREFAHLKELIGARFDGHQREHEASKESFKVFTTVLDHQDTRLRNMETTAANYYGRLWAFGVTITSVVTIISVGLSFLMR